MTDTFASTATTSDLVRGAESLLPPPPASHGEARTHRKERVAAALRLFALHGLNDGQAGHVTARDPEHANRFWVNPVMRNFALIRASDLLLVDDTGAVLEGVGHLNLAAFAIHSRIHKARPDVIGAAHAHSTFGKVWATTGRLLDPLSQDACAFYEDHAVYDEFRGHVIGLDEGDEVARALGARKAVVLRNHGLLTVGQSVEEAAWWFLAMNQACEVQVRAESIGVPLRIDHDTALETRARNGTPLAGRLQFEYESQVLDWTDVRS